MLEPWHLHFDPLTKAICLALVWIWLSLLLVELWGLVALWSIARLMGKLVTVDDYAMEHKQIGFAQVCLKIDLSRSLRPGVLINSLKGCHWQRFVYENLGSVSFGIDDSMLSGSCVRMWRMGDLRQGFD